MRYPLALTVALQSWQDSAACQASPWSGTLTTCQQAQAGERSPCQDQAAGHLAGV